VIKRFQDHLEGLPRPDLIIDDQDVDIFTDGFFHGSLLFLLRGRRESIRVLFGMKDSRGRKNVERLRWRTLFRGQVPRSPIARSDQCPYLLDGLRENPYNPAP
jgi:hypothetical protein